MVRKWRRFDKWSALAVLIPLILPAATVFADPYTWAGQSGNFSDPASWTASPPAPGGSATDQLIFNASSAFVATIDSASPWTANSLAFSGGADPTLAVFYSPGLVLAGLNPSIAISAQAAATINAPIAFTSNLTITGQANSGLIVNRPITDNGSGSALNIAGQIYFSYNGNIAPDFSGGTTVQASVHWNIGSADTTSTFWFGSGAITLDRGEFAIDDSNPLNLANALIVTNRGGAVELGDGSPAGMLDTVSGNISLGGSLFLSPFSPMQILGNITLDQGTGAALMIYGSGDISTSLIISGNILDDPDPAHSGRTPLVFHSYSLDAADGIFISGTNNTWSTGAIIEQGYVSVTPNSTLGTGNAEVREGGILCLSAPTNLAPGKTVLIADYDSTLAIAFDIDTSLLVDPASQGTLALDTTFTTPIDMSKLGAGDMSLGTTGDGVYAALSLLPAADHVYRFGPAPAGSGTTPNLTILHGVLADYDSIPSSAQLAGVTLAAANSYSGGSLVTGPVYATAPGALGTGDVTIGGPSVEGVYPLALTLTAPDAYAFSARIDVYGALIASGNNGSIPLTSTPPTFHPGSTLILGDNLTNNSDRYPDSLPINLRASSLELLGFGITNESVGPISYTGVSSILLQNPGTGSASTTLHAPSLTANPRGILLITPVNGTLGSDLLFLVDSPPPLTNNMLPPNLQMAETRDIADGSVTPVIPSFLTYGPSGFAAVPYVAMPAAGGSGTEIVDAFAPYQPYPPGFYDGQQLPPAPLPVFPPTTGPVTLAGDTAIYALRTDTDILSPAAGPATLTLGSGALLTYDYDVNGTTITIQPDLDFGPGEALIHTAALGDPFLGRPTVLAGKVTIRGGLVKFGAGTLVLPNPDNAIAGTIDVLQGSIAFFAIPDSTGSLPIILHDDVTVSTQSTQTLSRPIYIAGTTSSSSNLDVAAGQTLTLASPIVAHGGGLSIAGDGTLILDPGLSWHGASEFFEANTAVYLPHAAVSIPAHIVLGSLYGSGAITDYTALYLQGTVSPGDLPDEMATIQLLSSSALADLSDIVLDFDLASGGQSDQLLFSGPLLLDNRYSQNITLSLNFLAPPAGETYTLISAASISGLFDTVTGLPDGYALDYTADSILLAPIGDSSNSVPEPATLALFCLATWPLLRRRKRT